MTFFCVEQVIWVSFYVPFFLVIFSLILPGSIQPRLCLISLAFTSSFAVMMFTSVSPVALDDEAATK